MSDAITFTVPGVPGKNSMRLAELAYQWKAKNRTITGELSVTIEFHLDKPNRSNMIDKARAVLEDIGGIVFAKQSQIARLDICRVVSASPCTVVTIKEV